MGDFFLKMMNSKDPSISSSIFLAVVTTITILYAWAFVSIWTRDIHDIPIGVYTFAGIVILGRLGNKFAERSEPDRNTTITTESKTEVTTGRENENRTEGNTK